MGLSLTMTGTMDGFEQSVRISEESSYTEFKAALDDELKKSAEGFVRIGYLLKVARDTDVLSQSGYTSVTEFAKAEYGLSPDMVSRFIGINDRYAVDGYSDQLEEKYQTYGYAKLTELLSLPEGLAEEIPAELSRREIQEIKSEYREEQKVTDLEVYMEGLDDPQDGSTCAQVVRGYYKDHPEDFLKICDVIRRAEQEERKVETKEIIEEWAPSGIQTIITRIPGKGKVMMSIDTAKEDVTITNMRTQEKESSTHDAIMINVLMLCNLAEDPKEAWSKAFGEAFPEIAPVQDEGRKPERVKTPKKDRHTDAGGNTVTPAKNPLGEAEMSKNGEKSPESEKNAQMAAGFAQDQAKSAQTAAGIGQTAAADSGPEYLNQDGTPAVVVPDEVSTGQIIGSGMSRPLTEEQKYDREQARIDRQTRERLQEMEEENDLLPSERPRVVHELKISTLFFDDVAEGRKTFELRKNDRDYKVGQWLDLHECAGGAYTGRHIEAAIVFMLEDYTGLKDGYCILGIKVDNREWLKEPGIMNAPE